MPVVLHDDAVSAWLSSGDRDAGEMLALLVLQRSDDWHAYLVSSRVGNVRNDDRDRIEPVGPPRETPAHRPADRAAAD